MWKKILAGFFIGISLFAISSVGHSAGLTNTTKIEQEVDLTKYQLTEPQSDAYTIYDKITFINGKAPTGTSIIISVYGTTDLTRKSFDLSKLPTDDDYIEVFQETIKTGNIGTFGKQLDLVTGINKIIITFDVEGVPPVEIIVLVKTPETMNNNKEKKLENIIDAMLNIKL